MANDAVPFWIPGDTITAHCEAAVVGKRFVALSGPRVGGNPQISPAPAGGARGFGVASRDAAIGEKVMVGKVGIWPVLTGEAITAGDLITAGAAGVAMIADTAADVILGMAVDDAANATDCPVELFNAGAI